MLLNDKELLMANKQMKSYKRSAETPLIITEDQKKAMDACSLTANIIKYTLIAIVLLSLIFSMLALVKVEVKNDTLDKFAGDAEPYANISSFDVIKGWFAKSSFTVENRVNKGFVYKYAFDYIVDNIPALKKVVDMGPAGYGQIYQEITPKQDAMLNTAYIAILIIEVVSLVWLLVLAILFGVSFSKKFCPSQTFINTAVIIHFVLSFIMFAMMLALSSHSQANFIFSVGIGMWLNILVATIALCFVIANIIYRAKVKAYEEI